MAVDGVGEEFGETVSGGVMSAFCDFVGFYGEGALQAMRAWGLGCRENHHDSNSSIVRHIGISSGTARMKTILRERRCLCCP